MILYNKLKEIEEQTEQRILEEKRNLALDYFNSQEEWKYTSNCDGKEYIGVKIEREEIKILKSLKLKPSDFKVKLVQELWLDCYDYMIIDDKKFLY